MSLPVPDHPSIHKLDTTKLNTMEECPRKFFFEYILGWRSEHPDNHLHFGSCIHLALAHIKENGYGSVQVEEAQNLFELEYRKEFTPESDELHHPKDVFNARRALQSYVMEYPQDHQQYEVLFTEVSGSVPIDTERRLYLRMDTILRHRQEGYYFIQEHKTKGGAINPIWEAEWELAFQVGTYTHALYCMYPIDQVKGVQINGIAFIKAKATAGRNEFKRIAVWRTMKQMENWLWVANQRVDKVMFEMDNLSKCTEDDPILYAFPMCDRNCTKYFRICPYHDFCLTWGNPLRHAKQPPLGFKIERWDPEEKESKHQMTLEMKK